MFHEYALDPNVLSNWDRVRYFLDAFGPWKGRFIAKYPRNWKKLVYDVVKDRPNIEKKRIEQRLSAMTDSVFYSRVGTHYDGTKSWFANATIEHNRCCFHAIITEEPSNDSNVINGTEVDEQCHLWRVDSGKIVPRDPGHFVTIIKMLLIASEEIAIIDPYFQSGRLGKVQPLVEICKITANRQCSIQVHFSEHHVAYREAKRSAETALPSKLPEGAKVSLHCWNERKGGPRLHNRFIITNIGGVQFGDSVEAGDEGQEDRITILDENSHRLIWSQFIESPGAFDSAGPPIHVVGCRKRNRVHG